MVLFVIGLSFLSIYSPLVLSAQISNTATVSAPNRENASSTAISQVITPQQGVHLANNDRLGDAGAVLSAKLSMGSLAYGPNWFGGMTRNPWNTETGASGSSAGPGAATAPPASAIHSRRQVVNFFSSEKRYDMAELA